MSAQASAKTSPAAMNFSPERGPILSGQRGKSARGDVLDRADARDPAVLRRPRIAGGGPVAVVVHQRPRLRAVDLEALLHRLLAVVLALHERLAGDIVVPFVPRRVESDVVGAPGGRMHAPPAHARDD